MAILRFFLVLLAPGYLVEAAALRWVARLSWKRVVIAMAVLIPVKMAAFFIAYGVQQALRPRHYPAGVWFFMGVALLAGTWVVLRFAFSVSSRRAMGSAILVHLVFPAWPVYFLWKGAMAMVGKEG